MASNLRVDTILPSTGTTLGIGTASGTINFLGNSNITTTGTINAASATITGNLGVGGTLTYEDVTNIDSVGVITARSGINVSNDIKSADDDFFVYSYKGGSNGQVRSGIQFDSTNQRMEFYTATNERFRIETNGNITAYAGNLIIGTAGKGIDYSAQTPTAVSGATATGEVFDHYEEGTWTATLGNVNAPTYEAQGGVYTRIGRMVFCDCTIGVASGLDTSDGSGFQIRGLPFTGSTTGGTVCLFSLGRYTNLLGGKSTSVRNVRFLGDGVILQEGNDSDIAYNECSSSGYLQISFAYMMA